MFHCVYANFESTFTGSIAVINVRSERKGQQKYLTHLPNVKRIRHAKNATFRRNVDQDKSSRQGDHRVRHPHLFGLGRPATIAGPSVAVIVIQRSKLFPVESNPVPRAKKSTCIVVQFVQELPILVDIPRLVKFVKSNHRIVSINFFSSAQFLAKSSYWKFLWHRQVIATPVHRTIVGFVIWGFDAELNVCIWIIVGVHSVKYPVGPSWPTSVKKWHCYSILLA